MKCDVNTETWQKKKSFVSNICHKTQRGKKKRLKSWLFEAWVQPWVIISHRFPSFATVDACAELKTSCEVRVEPKRQKKKKKAESSPVVLRVWLKPSVLRQHTSVQFSVRGTKRSRLPWRRYICVVEERKKQSHRTTRVPVSPISQPNNQ